MSKYGKLVKNSVLFAMANVGSYFISFVLVRFYTELLSTEQYGMIDFLTVTATLVIPVFTLSIVEAVLRFSIDRTNIEEVFNNGIGVSIAGSIAFGVVGGIFFSATRYSEYFGFLAVYVFICNINNVCLQYVRGTGRVVPFAVSGIIKSAFLAISNIVFLLGFGWKIRGYLISLILSELASVVFLVCSGRLWKIWTFRMNLPLCKEMLTYSIPLIPTALSWWVMNASDKYVIIAVLGPAAAGIYAVSHKIPTLINLCNKVFFQAWQLSAVEEADSSQKSLFYSGVFNTLALFLMLAANLLLLFLRPLMHLLSAEAFSESWKYAPFLIISLVFSAFASFLGTNYVAMKKTKGAFKSTLFGVAVNLALNFALIHPLGMTGTAIATMIGFAATWIYRIFDTKQFISISYKPVSLIAALSCLILQGCVLVTEQPFAVYFGLFSLLVICILYRSETLKLCRAFASMISSRLKNR